MNKIALCLLFAITTSPCLAQTTPDLYLPDPQRTPGATNPDITQDNIHTNICKKGWSTKSERPSSSFTTRLKKKQLKDWGYHDLKPGDYEEDHLISLEIGGAPSDPLNLWPEPYEGTWGARTKDKVEDRLHKLVCDGTITLHEAQEAIRTNWIDAYKKYIGPNALGL